MKDATHAVSTKCLTDEVASSGVDGQKGPQSVEERPAVDQDEEASRKISCLLMMTSDLASRSDNFTIRV